MLSPIIRISQRYILPRIFVTFYYFTRYHCIISTKSQVQLSKNICFGKKTVVKPFSVINTHTGKIVVGKNCAISSFNNIATAEADIIIGDHVRTGPGVVIHGTRRRYKEADKLIVDQGYSHKGVKIGDDVLIGANAVVFECSIGQGAVVGAGSVVTKNVPSYSVAAGIPAKIIGKRE
jgi:acetyltransferase-like isoleucine patch superfamily enzyme